MSDVRARTLRQVLLMNDDVKAAADSALVESMLRQLRGSVSVGDEMTLDHACLIDDVEAWIAGEPARIAAAVAAAREEQRASDAEHLARIWYGLPDAGRADHGPVAVVRATPLTATPLADEIAALRARVAELEHQREGMLMGGVTTEARQQLERAEKAEAERDALRARDVSDHPGGALLVAEVASLRAQVEAARATLHRYIHEDDANSYPADEVISDILAAMDGAKP